MTAPINPEYLPHLGNYVPDKECGYTTPGWYFWDETWATCHGPYGTQEEAMTKLLEYCLWLEGKHAKDPLRD